jgi:hypothetical protein
MLSLTICTLLITGWAGDPVQLSSIRTTNAGQDFQGFW